MNAWMRSITGMLFLFFATSSHATEKHSPLKSTGVSVTDSLEVAGGLIAVVTIILVAVFLLRKMNNMPFKSNNDLAPTFQTPS